MATTYRVRTRTAESGSFTRGALPGRGRLLAFRHHLVGDGHDAGAEARDAAALGLVGEGVVGGGGEGAGVALQLLHLRLQRRELRGAVTAKRIGVDEDESLGDLRRHRGRAAAHEVGHRRDYSYSRGA